MSDTISAEPKPASEFDNFKTLAGNLIAVPKAEIDQKRAESDHC